MKPTQLTLGCMPKASYPIIINCTKCGHQAEMRVSIDVMEKLHNLKCGNCGAKGRGVKVEILEGVDLGNSE